MAHCQVRVRPVCLSQRAVDRLEGRSSRAGAPGAPAASPRMSIGRNEPEYNEIRDPSAVSDSTSRRRGWSPTPNRFVRMTIRPTSRSRPNSTRIHSRPDCGEADSHFVSMSPSTAKRSRSDMAEAVIRSSESGTRTRDDSSTGSRAGRASSLHATASSNRRPGFPSPAVRAIASTEPLRIRPAELRPAQEKRGVHHHVPDADRPQTG